MISREICERVLLAASSTGADYAELFMEDTLDHSIELVGGKVDSVHDAQTAGAAVRVFLGLRSVMATTVDTSEEGLINAPAGPQRPSQRTGRRSALPFGSGSLGTGTP